MKWLTTPLLLLALLAAAAPAAAAQLATADAPAAVPEEVGPVGQLFAKIHQGKKTGYALIAMSVAGLAFVFERLVGLRRRKIVPAGLAQRAAELFDAREFDALQTHCRSDGSTLATIIDALVEHRDYAVADARTLADDVGSYDLSLHTQRNHPLLIIGTLAPLLGLLGTVFGMIRSFEDVAALGSLGDPRVLADGISQALVTTAMGLVIAVPALIFYHTFKTRLNRNRSLLERQVTELIRRWFVKPAATPRSPEAAADV